jgi:hypothetical protein
MLTEDSDAVETVSAEAAPEGGGEVSAETSAPEPVDTTPTETQEATPVEAEEEIEVPPVFDWNGEFESLQSADWVQKLDENIRNPLLKGIQEKYQNWQRGYTNKYQDVAKQRREAEERLNEVREQELRVQRWLHGDVDPMVAKQKEMDEMRVAHRAALQALRKDAEEAHEKASRSHGTALEQAAEERDTAIQKFQEMQQQLQQIEEKQVETQVDALENWLTTEHKDIYDNDEAFTKFCLLAKAEVPPDEAVKMVRSLYPAPEPEPEPEPAPAPEPDPVPEGMKLMNMGPDTAAATEGGDPRSYQDIMEGLRKNALREQELLLNS